MYIDYSIKLNEPTVRIINGTQHFLWSQILRMYIEIYNN